MIKTNERMMRPCKGCMFSNCEYGEHGMDDYWCIGFGKVINISWHMYHEQSDCERNLTSDELGELIGKSGD